MKLNSTTKHTPSSYQTSISFVASGSSPGGLITMRLEKNSVKLEGSLSACVKALFMQT